LGIDRVTIESDYNDAALPLEVVINVLGQGGVPGLSPPPTVAVRLNPSTGNYLDWTTMTFRTSGWVTKNQPMTDLGTGVYQTLLNVQALGFTPLSGLPQVLTAEYTSTGAGTSGLSSELVFISELRPDAELARQYSTNRLEAAGGNPGSLTLYDDGGVNPIKTQTLRDFAGGPVANTPNTPAKRGTATP
jgi:hypothetical protein